MKITTLFLDSFGKFTDEKISLKNGINVIYGTNESGKSTIVQFIGGVFYGFLRRDVKGRRLSAAYGQFLPWQNPNCFSGKIAVEINQKQYILARNFLKNNPEITVYDQNGAEITTAFPYNSALRMYDPGPELLRLSHTAFINTVCVPQGMCRTEGPAEHGLTEQLLAAVQEDGNQISVSSAIALLEKKENQIGSERRASPYKSCLMKIENLRRELEEQQKAEDIFFTYRHNLNIKTDELIHIKQRKSELAIQRAAYEQQKLALDECTARISLLKTRLEALGLENIPADVLDDISIYEKKSALYASRKQEIRDTEAIDRVLHALEKKDSHFWKSAFFLGIAATALGLFTGIFFPYALLFSALGAVLCASAYLRLSHAKKAFAEAAEKAGIPPNSSRDQLIKKAARQELLRQDTENLFSELDQYFSAFYKGWKPEDIPEFSKDIREAADIRKQLDDLRKRAEQQEKNLQSNFDSDEFSRISSLYDLCLADISKMQAYIEMMQSNSRSSGEILAELTHAEKELEKMQNKKDALVLAASRLNQIQEEMQDEIAPKINRTITKWVGTATDGRYSHVILTRSLDVKAGTDGFTAPVDSRRLSRGTADLLYLAARLSLAESLRHDTQFPPVIFDDSFVFLDDARLGRFLQLLAEQKNRQILIFTCQNREKSILDQNNIPFHYIELL